MRKRGTRLILGLLLLGVLLCGGMLLWKRPGPIPSVARQYPADNAYPKYIQIAERLRDHLNSDPRLKSIYARMPNRVSDAEYNYFLKQTQPLMDAYAQLVNDPCVAVYEYRYDYSLTRDFAGIRHIARVESYHLQALQRRRRWRELVERAHSMLKFSHQIRNEGLAMHHLVGRAVEAMAIQPLRESFTQIDEPAALQALVKLAQEYERFRVPFHQAMNHEKCLGYRLYQQCRESPLREIADWRTLLGLQGDADATRMQREALLFRFAGADMLTEYERLMSWVLAEAQKPYWEPSTPKPKPRYYLNELLTPFHLSEDSPRSLEPKYLAQVRTLGVAAAARLHQQRTGEYPATLEPLLLGAIATDPFTGKPLVYRTNPTHGFQVYSLGMNRKDDGGRAPYGAGWDIGDITPLQFPAKSAARTALTEPVWMR
ncbi:MAG: hypothetical protein KatS3mg017_0784 [Fimbriimonadales bacterium]|nr:MAG: hypothetical protein KatS3mg017_0784 [Fimbriimonadales bacterium]